MASRLVTHVNRSIRSSPQTHNTAGGHVLVYWNNSSGGSPEIPVEPEGDYGGVPGVSFCHHGLFPNFSVFRVSATNRRQVPNPPAFPDTGLTRKLFSGSPIPG